MWSRLCKGVGGRVDRERLIGNYTHSVQPLSGVDETLECQKRPTTVSKETYYSGVDETV